jgi:hypothetical protein
MVIGHNVNDPLATSCGYSHACSTAEISSGCRGPNRCCLVYSVESNGTGRGVATCTESDNNRCCRCRGIDEVVSRDTMIVSRKIEVLSESFRASSNGARYASRFSCGASTDENETVTAACSKSGDC